MSRKLCWHWIKQSKTHPWTKKNYVKNSFHSANRIKDSWLYSEKKLASLSNSKIDGSHCYTIQDYWNPFWHHTNYNWNWFRKFSTKKNASDVFTIVASAFLRRRFFCQKNIIRSETRNNENEIEIEISSSKSIYDLTV